MLSASSHFYKPTNRMINNIYMKICFAIITKTIQSDLHISWIISLLLSNCRDWVRKTKSLITTWLIRELLLS